MLLNAELNIHSIIHLKLNIIRAILKVGKRPVQAYVACCYPSVEFTELFQIFILSYVLRQNKHYFKLAGYLEISTRTSFSRNRVH